MTAAIIGAQTRLHELGLYTGSVDGIDGPRTLAAIVAFQRSHNLTPDGIVGPLTEKALYPNAVAARTAETPQAIPVAGKPVWPLQRNAEAFYGAPGANQVMLELPYPMKLAWDKKQVISRFSINRKCHDSALRCFQRVMAAYDDAHRADLGLDLFGGCLNVRRMTGSTNWSMHAFGCAIDFDPDRNQFSWDKDRARLAKPDAEAFWKIWEDEGWVSLGITRNIDYMHLQAVRL